MATYLCVKMGNNQTKSYSVKSSANKPYMRVSTGYLPLTTQTATDAGIRIKSGSNVYRVIESYTTTTSVETSRSSQYDTSSTNTYTYNTSRSSQYDTSRSSQYDTSSTNTYTYISNETSVYLDTRGDNTVNLFTGQASFTRLKNNNVSLHTVHVSARNYLSAFTQYGDLSHSISAQVLGISGNKTTTFGGSTTAKNSSATSYGNNINASTTAFSKSITVKAVYSAKMVEISSIVTTNYQSASSNNTKWEESMTDFISRPAFMSSFGVTETQTSKTNQKANTKFTGTVQELEIRSCSRIYTYTKNDKTSTSNYTSSRSSGYTSSRQSDYTTNDKTSTSNYTSSRSSTYTSEQTITVDG